MPTLDFATSTDALGTSAKDGAGFVILNFVELFGGIMVAGAVFRGLQSVAKHFGLGRAKV